MSWIEKRETEACWEVASQPDVDAVQQVAREFNRLLSEESQIVQQETFFKGKLYSGEKRRRGEGERHTYKNERRENKQTNKTRTKK